MTGVPATTAAPERSRRPRRGLRRGWAAVAAAVSCLGLGGPSIAQATGQAPPSPGSAPDQKSPPIVNPKPSPRDWAALAKLPDWTGVWVPDKKHPNFPFAKGTPPPWNPAAARYIAEQQALDKAGRPNNIYVNCLPEGMPSFVIMTLNASEFLFTPGRVTILNEFDGNRQRRIYTDGRGHPEDPDLTFNGHSIGHWEHGTLVVDTVGILPQTFLPLGQSVGHPNNGDLRIIEHIHLAEPDRLEDELEIIAPHVLTAPWKLTKSFVRSRLRADDIIEASCREGDFVAALDSHGNHVFKEIAHEEGGAPLPPKQASVEPHKLARPEAKP